MNEKVCDSQGIKKIPCDSTVHVINGDLLSKHNQPKTSWAAGCVKHKSAKNKLGSQVLTPGVLCDSIVINNWRNLLLTKLSSLKPGL